MDVSSDEINFEDSDNDGPSPRQTTETAKGRTSEGKEMKTPEKASAPARGSLEKKTPQKTTPSARAAQEKKTPQKTTPSARAAQEKKTPQKTTPSARAAQEKKTPQKPTPSARAAQEKKTPEKANARPSAGKACASEEKKTQEKTTPSARASEGKGTLEKASARPSAIKARTSEEEKTPEKPRASARASEGKKTLEKPSAGPSTAKARASEEKKTREKQSAPKGNRQDNASEELSDTSSDSGTEEDQIPPKKSKRPAAKVASGARGSKKYTLVPESESGTHEDEILPKKPKEQVAKTASGAKKSTLVEESESGIHEDEIAPKMAKDPVAKAASGARQPKKATLINDLKDLKSEDMIPTPQKPRQLKRSSTSELLVKAKRRSLTRNAVEPKKVNYDVKYHPMDKTTRPNAPVTRRVKEEFGDDDEKADDEDDAEADDEATPTKMALRGCRGKKANYDMTAHPLNPLFQTKSSSRKSSSKAESPAVEDNLMAFSDIVGDSWEELDPVDKRLHDLQEGAPDDSNALPLKWSEVASTLIEEGYFTKKQFNRGGGVPAMRERYEEIRQTVQDPCADLEPQDRDDRRLFYQEGFDVFDVEGLNTIYVNPNIPEYMRGIKKFTAKDIAKYEQEFESARNNVTMDTQDTSMSNSSATKPDESQKITITQSEPEVSDALETPDKRFATLLKNDIRRMDELNEHIVSTEDIAMAVDDFGQATPAKIILSRSASAAGTVTDSPSRSRIESAAKTLVAPIASMITPLTKEELAEQSIAATKAFLSSPSPRSRGTSSSLVDPLIAGPDADASKQLLSETKPPTIFGKILAETIPGSTKKQLKRGKRKIKAASATDFAIHEDTPGNTPKSKPRRDAVTLETLKENMPEEWEHPQPMLDALSAQYHDGHARRQAAGAAEARQLGGTPRSSHTSPDPPAASSPFQPSGSLSSAIPSTEDSIDVPATPSAGARVRESSRGISVVIPHFVRESQD